MSRLIAALSSSMSTIPVHILSLLHPGSYWCNAGCIAGPVEEGTFSSSCEGSVLPCTAMLDHSSCQLQRGCTWVGSDSDSNSIAPSPASSGTIQAPAGTASGKLKQCCAGIHVCASMGVACMLMQVHNVHGAILHNTCRMSAQRLFGMDCLIDLPFCIVCSLRCDWMLGFAFALLPAIHFGLPLADR